MLTVLLAVSITTNLPLTLVNDLDEDIEFDVRSTDTKADIEDTSIESFGYGEFDQGIITARVNMFIRADDDADISAVVRTAHYELIRDGIEFGCVEIRDISCIDSH